MDRRTFALNAASLAALALAGARRRARAQAAPVAGVDYLASWPGRSPWHAPARSR